MLGAWDWERGAREVGPKHPGEKPIEGRIGGGSVSPWGRVRGCGRPAFFADVLEDMRPVGSERCLKDGGFEGH